MPWLFYAVKGEEERLPERRFSLFIVPKCSARCSNPSSTEQCQDDTTCKDEWSNHMALKRNCLVLQSRACPATVDGDVLIADKYVGIWP